MKKLLQSAADNLYSDSAKTIRYCKEAIHLSNRLHYAYGAMRGYIYLGDVYYQSSRYGDSYAAFMTAKKIGDASADKRGFSYFYNDLGLFYNSIQEYDSALNSFHNSLAYIPDTSAKGLSEAFLNIGVTYGGAGDIGRAATYLNKALQIAQEKHMDQNLAFIYMNLGNAYADARHPQLQRATDYFKQALTAAGKTGNTYVQSIAYASLGDICNRQGQFDQALAYSRQAMDITRKAGFASLQMYSQFGYCEILTKMHRFEASDSALKNIAKTFYLTLNDRKQYLKSYIDLYKEWGNYKKALELSDQLKKVTDSIAEMTNKRNMDILDARFRFHEQETRITDLKKENNWKTRLVKISVVAVIMSFLFIGMLIYSKRLKSRVLLQKQQVLKEENARMKMEKALAEEKAVRVKEDLDHKNRALSASVVHSEQMARILFGIKEKLSDTEKLRDPAYVEDIRKIIRHNIHLQEDWQKFKMHFEEVHPSFFSKLALIAPQLSKNELKQCAYIRMNMSNKEVAALLNVSPDSVKMSRYRIKKKLGLPFSTDLGEYIASL
ncbi:tetratricopeptide repeat protein [Niabella ginsenosidivorans]|uniref:tetratricopeptide repeat protein n=1 Tax=Niabella ginsenosidivorans TaxID=1176587 RepID=UPI001471CEB9|nr:tetratricopeptide repeat protein [Niabella ginsenosidivorans]